LPAHEPAAAAAAAARQPTSTSEAEERRADWLTDIATREMKNKKTIVPSAAATRRFNPCFLVDNLNLKFSFF